MKVVTIDILALTSFFVALASFFISYFTYKKNSGQLQVSLIVGSELNAETFDVLRKGFYLKVISVGHRPVIFASIGGDKSNILKRLLGYFFPETFQTTSFILSGEKLRPILFSDVACQNYRVMSEGEVFTYFFPFPENKPLAEELAKSKNFYISDSIEKKHKASGRVFRKFKADLKKEA